MGIHFRGRGQRDTEGRVPARKRHATTPSQEKIYPYERDERGDWNPQRKQWMPRFLRIYAISFYARRWDEEREVYQAWHTCAVHVCATDEEAEDTGWDLAYKHLPEDDGWEAHSVEVLPVPNEKINLVIESYQAAGYNL